RFHASVRRPSRAPTNNAEQPQHREAEQRTADRLGVLDRARAPARAELIIGARVPFAATFTAAALTLALVPLVEQIVDLLGAVGQVDQRRVGGHALLIDVLVPRHLVLEVGP